MLSNTANASAADLRKDFLRQGVDLPESHIVTSGMAIVPHLQKLHLEGRNILCLGNAETRRYLREGHFKPMSPVGIDNRLDEVNAVLIGAPGNLRDGNDHWYISGKLIDSAISVLRFRREVKGIIANPDEIVPAKHSTVIIGCGSIGRMIERDSGRVLTRLGKPYKPIYDLALEVARKHADGFSLDDIIMVGDSLQFDVKGAVNFGIKSLLVMTGNTRSEAEIERSRYQPDYVADAFRVD